ncbi:polyadenylate-binding protein RBP45-like protein isoform X1 [Tanacetum coccineum]
MNYIWSNKVTSLEKKQKSQAAGRIVKHMIKEAMKEVFTGDLDLNVTGKHLHQVFRQYGQLVHAKIHAGKQCGFVQLAERRCDGKL